MNVSSWRRPIVLIPALLAVGLSIYGAAWFAAASVLQDQARRWIEDRRRDGLSVVHDEVRLSGFPGRVVVSYPAWSVSRPGVWSWQTDLVSLWSQPWRPDRFTVDLSGDHTIDGMWSPMAVVSAGQAEVRPTLTLDGRLAEVFVTVRDLTAAGPDAAPLVKLSEAAVSIARRSDHDAPAARLSLSLNELSAPGLSEVGGLTPRLKSVRLTADLMNALTPGPLPSALAAWREGGGTIELRELYLDWPPLTVSGTGTLALDQDLQPIGAMTAKFTGFFETVDALTAHGLVRSADASMARIVLGILARTPEGGGPAEISLAVTAQNRKLYTGPLPLMTLPEVAWREDVTLP